MKRIWVFRSLRSKDCVRWLRFKIQRYQCYGKSERAPRVGLTVETIHVDFYADGPEPHGSAEQHCLSSIYPLPDVAFPPLF